MSKIGGEGLSGRGKGENGIEPKRVSLKLSHFSRKLCLLSYRGAALLLRWWNTRRLGNKAAMALSWAKLAGFNRGFPADEQR